MSARLIARRQEEGAATELRLSVLSPQSSAAPQRSSASTSRSRRSTTKTAVRVSSRLHQIRGFLLAPPHAPVWSSGATHLTNPSKGLGSGCDRRHAARRSISGTSRSIGPYYYRKQSRSVVSLRDQQDVAGRVGSCPTSSGRRRVGPWLPRERVPVPSSDCGGLPARKGARCARGMPGGIGAVAPAPVFAVTPNGWAGGGGCLRGRDRNREPLPALQDGNGQATRFVDISLSCGIGWPCVLLSLVGVLSDGGLRARVPCDLPSCRPRRWIRHRRPLSANSATGGAKRRLRSKRRSDGRACLWCHRESVFSGQRRHGSCTLQLCVLGIGVGSRCTRWR